MSLVVLGRALGGAEPDRDGGESYSAELAAAPGLHTLDVMCALALADDLQARFRVVLPQE